MPKVDVETVKETVKSAEELASEVTRLSKELEEATTKLAEVTGARDTLATENEGLKKQVEESIELAGEAEIAKTEADRKLKEAEDKIAPMIEGASELASVKAELESAKKDLEVTRGEITALTEKLDGATKEAAGVKEQFAVISEHLKVKGEQPLVEDAAKGEEKPVYARESAEFKRYSMARNSSKPADRAEAIKLATHPNVLKALEAEATGAMSALVEGPAVSDEDKQAYADYQQERASIKALEGMGAMLTGDQRKALADRKQKNNEKFVANAEVFARCAEAVAR